MRVPGTTTLLLIGAFMIPSWSSAAVWTVEKDGSGDFTIIQDAIDAAASGDSILVGPGRFDTFRPAASTVDGFQFAAIAWVATANISMIGAGMNQTVIGPSAYAHESDGRPAGSVYFDGGAGGAVLVGVSIENAQGPMTVRDQVLVESCRLTKSDPGATFSIGIIDGFDTVIRGCEFFGGDGILTGSGSGRLTVEDCIFDDATGEGTAIEIGNGAQDCTIRRCELAGGSVGLSFSLGGTGVVEDCRLQDIADFGINVPMGDAVVRNCRLGVTRISLRIGIGRLEVYDTLVGGGTQSTVFSTAEVYIRRSHILNAGGVSVFGRTSVPGELIDLRDNWWGTADTLLIESWIDDAFGTVLWQPIANAPVPTESSSVGALKGRFRGSRVDGN